MNWNFKDNAPIYLQIVSGLQKAIVNGTYPPGSRLPSVRDLALEAGVNPNTMQRALAELERAGLVYTVRTSGRFVTEEASLLQDLRQELSGKIIAEFFSSLRELGMTDDDILSAVTKWASRGSHADETAKIPDTNSPEQNHKETTASGGTL